ncbi:MULTISPECIES: hypothetical protein [Bosea]|jgi:hypothetical protein|uniref:Uncharacterized protein n=1 Tax=Bosea vaviloviae TaxID=1526658 RepID=A0A0N1F5C8_9HYPH|nr:hypothetical protein [Bosea vaviloviae]KPH80817.1 hypothetical protein AE618_11350 [Bosea vaviloviae]
MSLKTPAGGEPRPNDAELEMYARAYRQRAEADTFYLRWQLHTAHAMLLEHDPTRIYPEHGGLNGRQIGEGARIAARRFALLLAEPPAFSEPLLRLKIAAYEAMIIDADELRRSRAVAMIEAAIRRDAQDLGIVLDEGPVMPDAGGWH